MADALISAILQQLAKIIDAEIQQRLKLVVGVEKQVQNVTYLFEAIQAVIEDAERRQHKEATIKTWLAKLKDVAYDMDDVLDEWSSATLKWQLEDPANTPLITKKKKKKIVSCFLPSSCFCFNFNGVILRHDIAHKIKEVCERVDEIVKESVFYNFRHSKQNEDRVGKEPGRQISTSFIDVSRVRGREEDKKIIVSKLMSEYNEESGGGINVISIVGMGGIGKTTLAQLAYNDDDVKTHFKKRIWVCVSEPFDQVRIVKAILESLCGFTPNLIELQSLLQNVSKLIRRKKVLVVLDDVWTQDYGEWEPLKHCLRCAGRGSKILVTTRKESVAKKMESACLFHLGQLSRDECWELFSEAAFYGRGRDECEDLMEMSMKIANKCKGLPFAAKTLGDLLQLKRTKEEWQNVLASELWELEEVERGLFPPLLLSYYDLPTAVRRCFLYCSVFPKDYKMEKTELIHLWMAHGYLGEKEMEFVGKGYFDNLVMHSFFQDFEEIEEVIDFNMKNVTTRFKMHDVVHDFVQSLMKNECFRLDVDGKSSIAFPYEKARFLTVNISEGAQFPLSIYKAKKLRSLSIMSKTASVHSVLADLFLHCTFLRSLDLSESSIEELPSEVGKLIHLRNLNLSQNAALGTLPETVTDLCNLQCLNLTSCSSLRRLPYGLAKLIKLRHLQMIGSSINFLPKGLGSLSFLQTLSYFIVCSGENELEAANLAELKNLNNLRGNLLVRNLGNVGDVGKALDAELKNKKNLHGLFLDFTREEIGLPVNDDDLIDALEAPPELEYLRIGAYKGVSFPNWIMSLAKLKELEIVDGRCEFLPPLGRLSSLVKLTMNIRGVRRLDIGFLGIDTASAAAGNASFPKLKELNLWYMKELEDWDGRGSRIGENDSTEIMPQLQHLRILDCPKVKELPDYIFTAKLEHLTLSECPILRERYRRGTGVDSHKISHIPHVNMIH